MKFRNVSTEDEENVEVDNSIDKIVKQCREFEKVKHGEYKKEAIEDYSFIENIILTPATIELLYQKIKKDKPQEYGLKVKDIYSNILMGPFFPKLIQNSYNSGNNGFLLSYMPTMFNLKGSKDNLLEITLEADKIIYLGWNSEYAHFNVNNDLFKISGINSENNVFTLMGKICEEPSNGSVNNCLFRTPNIETYHILRKSIEGKNNTYNLIDKQGEIIRETIR